MSSQDKADLAPLLEKQPVIIQQQQRNSRSKYAVLAVAGLSLLSVASYGFTCRYDLMKSSPPSNLQVCPSTDALPVDAPKLNIWQNIDMNEVITIRRFLDDPKHGLNLTRGTDLTDFDNFVGVIELVHPPKQKALAYLDGDEQQPERYVHAVINHGADKDPSIKDWLIGPLPITESTKLVQRTDVYHEPTVPFNARGLFATGTIKLMARFVQKTFGPLAHITKDLFGGSVTGDWEKDTLVMGGSAPMSYDGSFRRMWMPLKASPDLPSKQISDKVAQLNVPGSFIHPVDFNLYCDFTGPDPDLWKVLKVVYNHQIFSSLDEFVAAYDNNSLERSAKPEFKSDWASRAPRGTPRDLDDRAGPQSVMFDGPRYRADLTQDYVSWLGWSLYLGFEHDMGLSLWNINFRGERIIYEISPQEAMAQYSGNDPHQASTVWLDRAFGMGQNVRELLKGYDCPVDALYMPATVHTGTGSTTRRDAICVFERDSGRPLSRHTAYMKDEMGATKGYELVVRSVSTVGNYDYLFDYTFQLDGSIEIRLSASGYLQGGVWDDKQAEYGHRLRETTMGSLHDHVINYKVDFDIAGTRNSMVAVKLELEEREEKWFDEDWGSQVVQQKIVRDVIDSEDDGRLEYRPNGQGVYVVTNQEQTNKWGNPRGYAIHPGASPVHLTNLDSKRTEHNVDWAKHHVSVTRRKDTEPYSSSAWNMNLPGKPTVDFAKFFDGESLVQEDLVTWINLGTHHIPRAEDSPQTLTNLATSYVLLTPYNFNDYDVAMEMQNAVIVNAPSAGQAWAVKNHIAPSYCLPRRPQAFNYSGMLSWEADGTPSAPASVRQMRMEAEGVHALYAEL